MKNASIRAAIAAILLSAVPTIVGCGGGGSGSQSAVTAAPTVISPAPTPTVVQPQALPANMPKGASYAVTRVKDPSGAYSVLIQKEDGTVVKPSDIPLSALPFTVAFWGADATGAPEWLAETAFAKAGNALQITEEDTGGTSYGVLTLVKASNAQGNYVHFTDLAGAVTDQPYDPGMNINAAAFAAHALLLSGPNGYANIPGTGGYAAVEVFPAAEIGADLFYAF